MQRRNAASGGREASCRSVQRTGLPSFLWWLLLNLLNLSVIFCCHNFRVAVYKAAVVMNCELVWMRLHVNPNLVTRALGLFSQRVSARSDSGIANAIFPENVWFQSWCACLKLELEKVILTMVSWNGGWNVLEKDWSQSYSTLRETGFFSQ